MLEENRVRELRRFECDILDLIQKVRTWGTKRPKVKGVIRDWGTSPKAVAPLNLYGEGQSDRKSGTPVGRESDHANGSSRVWNGDNPKKRPRGSPARWKDPATVEAWPEDPNAPRLPSRNPLVPPTLAIQTDEPPPHMLDKRRKEEVRKTLQQFEALTGVLVTIPGRRSPSPSNETDELPSVSGKELMTTQLSSKQLPAAARPPKSVQRARPAPLPQTVSRPPPGLPPPSKRPVPRTAPSPVRAVPPKTHSPPGPPRLPVSMRSPRAKKAKEADRPQTSERRAAWRKPPRWSINSTPERTRGVSAKFDEVMGDAASMDDDGMPALKLVKKVPPKMGDDIVLTPERPRNGEAKGRLASTSLNVNAPDWRPPPPGLGASDPHKRQGPSGSMRPPPSKNRPPPHWSKPKSMGRQSYQSDRGRYQNSHQPAPGGSYSQGLDLTPPMETFQGVDRWGGGPMPVAPPPRNYRQPRRSNNPPNGPPPNGHWTPSPKQSRSPRSRTTPAPIAKPAAQPVQPIASSGSASNGGSAWRDEVIEINMEGQYEEQQEKPPTALSAAAEPFVPQDETLLDQSNGDRLKFRKTHLNKIDEVPETECDIRGGDPEGDPLTEDNAFIDLNDISIGDGPVTPTRQDAARPRPGHEKTPPVAQWKLETSPPRPGTPEEVSSSKSSWLAWKGYAAPILDLSELDEVAVEELPESAYCGSDEDTMVRTPRKAGDAGTNSLIEVTGSDIDTDPTVPEKAGATNPDLDGVGDEFTNVTEPQLIDEPTSTRRRAPSAPSGSAKPATGPSSYDRLREFTSDGQDILALVGTFLGLGCK